MIDAWSSERGCAVVDETDIAGHRQIGNPYSPDLSTLRSRSAGCRTLHGCNAGQIDDRALVHANIETEVAEPAQRRRQTRTSITERVSI